MTPEPEQRGPAQATDAQSNLTQRTLVALFWMVGGSGVFALLRLLMIVVLSRLLVPADFGTIGAALIIVGFAQLLSQIGMEPALIQRAELDERHIGTAFTAFTVFGVLMAACIVVLAPLLAGFFRIDGLVAVLYALTPIFLLHGVLCVPSALLKRELRFRWVAAIHVISYALGYGVAGIGLALAGYGVWALTGAVLVEAVVGAVMLLLIQPFTKRPRFDVTAFRELLYFGGGFTIARLLNYVALQGDNTVAGRWLGADGLGVYSRAYQLLVFPINLFVTALDEVLFPSMAKVQQDTERLGLMYRRGVLLIALIILPLSVVSIVLAPELIRVVLGPEWSAVVAPFQLLAAGMLFRASYKMSDSLARATGAVYRRSWRQALYALSIVCGAIIGQRWGVEGIAAGVLPGLVLNFVLMAKLSLNITGLGWRAFIMAHRPAVLLALLCLAEVWVSATVLRGLGLPAIVTLAASSLLVGCGVLGISMFASKQLLGEDALWIRQTMTAFARRKRAKQPRPRLDGTKTVEL